MAVFNHKTLIRRLVSALLIIVLLSAALPQPTLAESPECKCEGCCEDHENTECSCIGCPLVLLANVVSVLEISYLPDTSNFSHACHHNMLKCDFYDRLDRPPQFLL